METSVVEQPVVVEQPQPAQPHKLTPDEQIEREIARVCGCHYSQVNQITRRQLCHLLVRQYVVIQGLSLELFCAHPDHPSFDNLPPEIRVMFTKTRTERLWSTDSNISRTARR